MVGIISVVIGDHFGGGDHFDGGDHFGGGTGLPVLCNNESSPGNEVDSSQQPSNPAALAVLVHSLVKGAKKEIWRKKVATGVKRTIGHVILV